MLEELSLHKSAAAPAPIVMAAATSLKTLNLDNELFQNYQEAKLYLDIVLSDGSIPPNQVAQTFNTITAILKEIVKTQTEVYNAERIKNLEDAIVTALKLTSEDVQEAFFTEFERLSK